MPSKPSLNETRTEAFARYCRIAQDLTTTAVNRKRMDLSDASVLSALADARAALDEAERMVREAY